MSIVSTVSVPRPENDRVRRTCPQRTSARRRAVPLRRSRTTADGSQARVRVRRTARRQSRRISPGVSSGATSGRTIPRGSVRTITRAVLPVSRALR